VLAQLLEGNKRFASGQLTHPGRSPKDFSALAEGQAPLAVIVGCADSRVAPELIFDQGVGDLFVVRVAGNIVSGAGSAARVPP
jgi:carbonic anhydrase